LTKTLSLKQGGCCGLRFLLLETKTARRKGMGTQVKICLMEMDPRTKQTMSLVFSHRLDDAIVLADEDTADVAVLDLDLNNALAGYQTIHARRPALRAIGLSSKLGHECDDVLVLQKPISPNRLLEAIQKVSGVGPKVNTAGAASSLSMRIGGSRRRNEAAAPKASDKLSFNPNDYLLGAILTVAAEAEKKDMVGVVSFYGDRIILVDNKSKIIRTNLSSSQARAFALSAVGADDGDNLSATVGLKRPAFEYLARAEAEKKFASKTYSVPQEIFMWKLGAMSSRGRLPADVNPDERVYLRRWPNMTRFSYTDNEMRVVAYWLRQACSMREITEALDIPEQEVFGVYVAAYAAGLAGKARREADGIWEAPEVAEHKERGLFSSILKRLTQRKPAEVEKEEALA
jgi:hypothetical protein